MVASVKNFVILETIFMFFKYKSVFIKIKLVIFKR